MASSHGAALDRGGRQGNADALDGEHPGHDPELHPTLVETGFYSMNETESQNLALDDPPGCWNESEAFQNHKHGVG